DSGRAGGYVGSGTLHYVLNRRHVRTTYAIDGSIIRLGTGGAFTITHEPTPFSTSGLLQMTFSGTVQQRLGALTNSVSMWQARDVSLAELVRRGQATRSF